MEDQGRGIKVEVRGSRSEEGSRFGVKVGGQGRRRGQGLGVEVVVKVGGQDRRRGHCLGSRFGGQGCGQGRGQGHGVKVRGMIGGHKVGVSVGV